MSVLVTGGAGYIGSHTVRALKSRGKPFVIYDNFVTGYKASVAGFPVIEGDIRDTARLCEVMKEYEVDSVIHFAASTQVAESMREPAKYYSNNIAGTLSLLDAMRVHDVRRIVFSSSAGIYGIPEKSPITEDMPKTPINVYGRTKYIMEEIIRDYGVYGIQWVAFRYFNACGADESGEIGELHRPETHLIPNVIGALLAGTALSLYGSDYNTPDGTCIRDYIHVSDLADVHCTALDYLAGGGESMAFNLGYGRGYSNLEIVSAVERVTGGKVLVERAPRRPGDPDMLVADSGLARSVMGWKPRFDDIDLIISSAYKWHSTHPDGF